MIILIIFAVISLVLGLLFLGGEENLKKLDRIMNKTILSLGTGALDKSKEKLVGIFLIVFSVILVFVASSIKK